MEAEVRVSDEGWRGPLASFHGVLGFDVAVDCGGELVWDFLVGWLELPSRTLKPMFDQSMVLTGGGGKAILKFVKGRRRAVRLEGSCNI